MASEDCAVTIPDFAAWKRQGRKISVLTAYDYPLARLFDAAGVDCLLVGDSMGTTVQGKDTTLGVTLEQMVYHAEMVARAARKAPWWPTCRFCRIRFRDARPSAPVA